MSHRFADAAFTGNSIFRARLRFDAFLRWIADLMRGITAPPRPLYVSPIVTPLLALVVVDIRPRNIATEHRSLETFVILGIE